MRKLALSDEILLSVQQPARYLGNEMNVVMKDPSAVDIRFAMCFPDVYEIGMSHLGMQILYAMFNKREDVWCERLFSPWTDLDKVMREQHIPLFALESQDPVKNFDFLGFTIQYEMCYTNILQVLDLSGSPLHATDRTEKDPIVIGGGPCGLSCAFYLQLMGHQTVVYEQRPKLGGMLRYGIPRYRLPEDMLQNDIDVILSTGVEVHTDISVGKDIQVADIEREYDAVLLCIGAHVDRKVGIPGEDSNGVVSAVAMLRAIGEGNPPDLTGKRVCVIGGGNVSMDASRTAIRLGASNVTTVYRRRVDDMTALSDEIAEAAAEGVTILPLQAPLRIEHDDEGNVTALITQPQHIGPVGKDGRPRPIKATKEENVIPCDIVIVAIGQGIDSRAFAAAGIAVNRERFSALPDSIVEGSTKTFAGGDAVTGPSTVIRAIAAGKVAAANIDNFLGYNHVIHAAVEDIPEAPLSPTTACGRVNIRTRPACECVDNFDDIKEGMTEEEVLQESSRCLRCDHYGYGNFRGGRMRQW